MSASAKVTTPVIFRVWQGEDEGAGVIAFFPATYGGAHGSEECNPYRMMSYQHVGQHGEADYQGLLVPYGCRAGQRPRTWTRPATPEEYAELLKELESIGYEGLTVVKRFNRRSK